MKNVPYISDAVIRRLPRYFRYLGELLNQGTERISSAELSKRMGLTASQVRQDLNLFGDFGQQGYGYNVAELRDEVAHILGLDVEHKLIIIGAGHLGTAVAGYANFGKRGFTVEAVFDANPAIIGTTVADHVVQDIQDVEKFLDKQAIDIAVLAIPKSEAHAVAERLVTAGIRYFWNFVSVDFQFTDSHIIVENVHLSDSLMSLSYRISKEQKER